MDFPEVRIFNQDVLYLPMANFNRDRNNRSSGGFRPRPSFGGRPKFGDRSDRGPVEMHKAVCDNCGRECEVPFRPTRGKPVFCSNCFERNNRETESGRFEGRDSGRPRNFEERQMFDAVCNNCGNSCKVPFQPTGDKPVYCSNCFGEKKGAGNKENGLSQSQSQPQYKEQLERLNNKLDKILQLLDPNSSVEGIEKKMVAQQQPQEQEVITQVKTKPAKKMPSKKKPQKIALV